MVRPGHALTRTSQSVAQPPGANIYQRNSWAPLALVNISHSPYQMVALLVDATLMKIPARLEVPPKGKVGHVFVRLVIEAMKGCV